MSSLAFGLAVLVSADPWLADARASLEFEVSSALAVDAGYALRIPVTSLDAGRPDAVAWRADGGWSVLPIARDSDPSSQDVWFALPQAMAAAAPVRFRVFFGGSVSSPLSPAQVFLRADDFSTCAFGTWVRRNGPALLSMDPSVSHGAGGCALRLASTTGGFATLATPEQYTAAVFDLWWRVEDANNAVFGNNMLLQPNGLEALSFGFLDSTSSWNIGSLTNAASTYTVGSQVSAPRPDAGWQRVVTRLTPTSFEACVDGVCVTDSVLGPPLALFDGGVLGIGRRVNTPSTDGGQALWADDVVVRAYQSPEPVVAAVSPLQLGPGVACSNEACFTGTCTSGLCPSGLGPEVDAGPSQLDAGVDSRALLVGCGCGVAPMPWWVGLVLLAGLIRRRRR